MGWRREGADQAVEAVVLGSFVLSLACGHKSPSTDPNRPAVADAGTTALEGTPVASASASSAPIDASKPRPPKPHAAAGPTAEAIAADAKTAVEEAVRHASAKDLCSEALPLLDVSYLIAHAATPVDENTLGSFATCAVEHQRWFVLRELAQAIAAGERKKETTYFLPRALIGLGSYDAANALAKATLRAWPTEGEAYTTAALAAFRVKDWDGSVKAADQALLLLKKQHAVPTRTTLLAHGLRGAALLRMGKLDEGVHEIELTKADDSVLRVTDVTLEGARAAKQYGLLASVDAPDAAYPALWPLYAKKVTPFAGLVTVVLQNLTDKPTAVVVEVTVDGGAPAAESETVQKGHPITLELTPELAATSPLLSLKAGEAREVVVTVSGGLAKTQLFRETRKVTFEPRDALPKVQRSHGDDLRSAFALEAAWVTPAAPPVVALVDAAKARLKGDAKTFAGGAGPSLPQAQALWDELRSRGVSFHRDPHIDTETHESTPCGLPAEILEAAGGSSLESSVLFASLLEAIGLDVVLVRTPGHRLVGWLGTPADLAAAGTAASTVKSPLGQAFFLETTTVGEGPFDAAVLRGAATWVAATNDGSIASGRAEVESVKELRKRGVVPRER